MHLLFFRKILDLLIPGPRWLGLIGNGWKNWNITLETNTLIQNDEKYLFSLDKDDYCAVVVVGPGEPPLVVATPCFFDKAFGICEIKKVPE